MESSIYLDAWKPALTTAGFHFCRREMSTSLDAFFVVLCTAEPASLGLQAQCVGAKQVLWHDTWTGVGDKSASPDFTSTGGARLSPTTAADSDGCDPEDTFLGPKAKCNTGLGWVGKRKIDRSRQCNTCFCCCLMLGRRHYPKN